MFLHYHFTEGIGKKFERKTPGEKILFLNVILGITGWDRHWITLLDTGLDLLLPFKMN